MSALAGTLERARPPVGLPPSGSRRATGLMVLAALPVAALGLFFLYPVGTLLGRGLLEDGSWQLGAFGEVLGRSRIRQILWFTVWQAAASAGLCLLLGIPGAYVLYRCSFRGRGVVRALVTIPFVLPTVVVGLAFRTLFADDGPLGSWGWDGTVGAILAAHVFLNYVVVVRTVGASWAGLDDREVLAARSLGAGPVRAFATVTLPALMPAVLGAASMVFLFCATSFGIMLVMGGGRYRTLETEIYRQTVVIFDLRTAAVLSVVQIVAVAVLLAITGLLRSRAEATWRTASTLRRGITRGAVPAVLITAVTVLAMVVPIAVLVVRSLRTQTSTGAGWGLDNYRALGTLGADNIMLVPVTTALGNSLRAAVFAAIGALVVGLAVSALLARRPRSTAGRRLLSSVDAVMMLPLGVSAVTVGFGFLIAFDSAPLDWRGQPWLVPVAQGLVAMPLVVRMILPVLRSTDDRLRQAAAVLGSSPLRVWRDVDLPIVSRALAGAAAFAFVIAMGEFGASSFLATPQNPTLPVVIGRLISRPGAANTGTALAAATVLAVTCVLAVLLVESLVRRGDRRNAADHLGGF
ncbi:iron ABC transporter permease [Nakamurella sp. A5-74]|uniref:Iron ABC transporter permease n=1 Tax=Nakamurella sp. A5-74 TaxID=3158264 RepID=A0AAU8DPP0_9ACTN